MQTREAFHDGLKQLRKSIMVLGKDAGFAFSESMEAFETNDLVKFTEIKKNDYKINLLELSINEKATLLIAKQQPVASDLRKIITAIKISSDLERVGDLAVDIAKAAKRIPQIGTGTGIDTSKLIEMSKIAREMLEKSLIAYQNENVLEAQRIAQVDDQVDELYAQFIKEIFKNGIAVQSGIENLTQLAFIARYIERIADYSTNIAELVIYEVNGQYYDLN
ncbi:phosphate signaling complex protein PhoU [Bacillaceae bacterium IKA-2]|nr:phosphate signaling complex protein PhoU [Bacillaceae bacterium IKA-2]